MRVIPNAHFSYADSLMSSMGNGWIRLRSKSAVGLICTPKVGLNKPTIEVQIFYGCSRSRILGNVTAKSGNFEKSVVSHFKRILTANFEKRKRPLN